MTIAFDALTDSTADETNVTTNSFSHSVGSGKHRMLLVMVQITHTAARVVSGITCGGRAMTRKSFSNALDSANTRQEIWALLQPAVGANAIVVTADGVSEILQASAISFVSEDLQIQVRQQLTHSVSAVVTTAPSIQLAPNHGDWCVDAVVGWGTMDPVVGSDQTQRLNAVTAVSSGGLAATYAVSTQLGTAGGAMSWTKTNASPHAYAAVVLMEYRGIVAYYRLEETSGQAIDSKGGHNLDEVSGTIPSIVGKIGNARDFEVADTEYFQTVAGDDLADMLLHSFTMSAWVDIDTIAATELTIASQWIATGNQRAWRIHYSPAAARFVFHVSADGGVAAPNFDAIGAVAFGTPPSGVVRKHHVVVRHDGDNGMMYITVDNLTDSVAHTEGMLASTAPLVIGALAVPAAWWDGVIDEVIFSNYSWSDDEVAWHYNNGEGRTFNEVMGIYPSRLSGVVYDTDGVTLIGALPKITAGLTKRSIDEAGSWWIEVPAVEASAAHLQIGNEVNLYYEGHGVRFYGIIESVDTLVSETGAIVRASGLSLAAELTYQNTYWDIDLENATQVAALEAIFANADTTWNDLVTGAGYQNITRRLDNMSLLEAVLKVGETSFAYTRETFTKRQLELKNTHADSQLILTNREDIGTPGTGRIALIKGTPVFKAEGIRLYNRVVPRGKSANDKVLDLSYSNRSSPYTIQSTVSPRPTPIDTASYQFNVSPNNSFTWSSDLVVAGANTAVLLFMVVENGATVDAVQIGGVTLVAANQFLAPSSSFVYSTKTYQVRAYYLLNPDPGRISVQVSVTADSDVLGRNVAFAALSMKGVYQAGSPIRNVATATATNSTPTVDVASNVDDLVIDWVLAFGATTYTPGAGQTSAPGPDFATPLWLSKENGVTGTVTMSWTLNASNVWAIIAASVRPATSFYIEDATSVTAYRRRVKQLPEVDFTKTVISDQDAANSLYDYAAFYLQTHKDPVTKVEQVQVAYLPDAYGDVLLPGDSVKLIFNGYVYDEDTSRRAWKNINTTMIVVEVDEDYAEEGRHWVLTLADKIRKDDDTESFLETIAKIERIKNVVST